ncbi:30S ribosomal protein S17 [Candidatus Uhrbacteria bacterium]|nr:30S ribosomal protein S17 [Candidatus Uhrbacteria bacterium]
MNTTSIQRTFTGVVASTKMKNTLVVRVERTVVHPKYGKRYVRTSTFHVHDEGETHKVGDMVTFRACHPISKTKCWRVLTASTE